MGERLVGQATKQGTLRGAESFEAGARMLGRTGYTVSPVGFGGYRVRDADPLHRRALADALRGGVNVIDTSTNYGDGRSEALVGIVLADLVQRGELRREHVVVVSKVGYAQGTNLDRLRERDVPDVVQYRPDCWHCIHPDFIRDQLEESLDRLGLEKLDVLLLHNPEYFLADAHARGRDSTEACAEYYARIGRAFAFLEQAVADGKIGGYGVSSNGFVEAPDDARFTSLAALVQLAREAGGDSHHFGVVQMPMNLFELGAATRTQPDGSASPLAIATAADLGVMINRPLNALVGGRLLRLADGVQGQGDRDFSAADAALQRVRKLEAQWATGLGAQILTEDGSDNAVDLFRLGQELSGKIAELDLERWQHLRHHVIAPMVGQTSASLLKSLTGDARDVFAQWWTRYGTALHEAFEAIEAALHGKQFDIANAIGDALDPHLPEPWRDLPLSRKAVLTALTAPVGTVLVGMRRPAYVHDIVALREHPVRLLSAAAGPVDLGALEAALAQIPAAAGLSPATT